MTKPIVEFHCRNGLGDKLLDSIGVCVLCHFLNYYPAIDFNPETSDVFAWGKNTYDLRLCTSLLFPTLERTNKHNIFYQVYSPNPSVSLCPYKVYSFLHNINPSITFEDVSAKYIEILHAYVVPSFCITSTFPQGIENAYGIHLRKSDKISSTKNGHECVLDEFNEITSRLIRDLKIIIDAEVEPAFFIVSEDKQWAGEIEACLKEYSSQCDRSIRLLTTNYPREIDFIGNRMVDGFESIADLFGLAKCKTIYQGVKYSTFSLVASMLGSGTLRNYARELDTSLTTDWVMVDAWSSVIDINGRGRVFDLNVHSKIACNDFVLSAVPNVQPFVPMSRRNQARRQRQNQARRHPLHGQSMIEMRQRRVQSHRGPVQRIQSYGGYVDGKSTIQMQRGQIERGPVQNNRANKKIQTIQQQLQL